MVERRTEAVPLKIRSQSRRAKRRRRRRSATGHETRKRVSRHISLLVLTPESDKKGSGDDEKPAAKELPPATDAPVPTSTPRKPSLSLGIEGLNLGTPTRNLSAYSPTEDKPSPFEDDRHQHGGPVLRPPAGMAPGPKGWSAMLEGTCPVSVHVALRYDTIC